MLSSIQFDYKSSFDTGKVRYVFSNGMLATEFVSAQMPAA